MHPHGRSGRDAGDDAGLMNQRARIETGLVVVGLAILVLGLLVGLDSMIMFIATLVVGLAVIAAWGLTYFGNRRNE